MTEIRALPQVTRLASKMRLTCRDTAWAKDIRVSAAEIQTQSTEADQAEEVDQKDTTTVVVIKYR